MLTMSGFILEEKINTGEMNKPKEKIMKYGPSYFVAGIHALILSTRGCQHFLQLLHTIPKYQMQQIPVSSILTHVEISAVDYRHITQAQTSVELSNLLFLSWIIYDLIHVISSYPKLGGFDTIIHHCLFMGAALVNGYYVIYIFPFSWLIMGELSTIFLNIRWFLIQTGRGSTKMMKWCNYIFAIFFFLTRVILYGWGLYLMSRPDVWTVILELPAPKYLVLSVLGLLVIGYFLNLLWMKSIVEMATKNNEKGRKSKKIPTKNI